MKGVSLLETVIYLGLIAVVMPIVAVLVFFSVDLKARGEESNIAILEGRRVTEIISQAMHNAKSINAPILGAASSTLSLSVNGAGKNPTVFNWNGVSITFKEGAGEAAPLTSSRITVSSASFANVSQAGTPGAARADFTLSANNFSKRFYITVALRQHSSLCGDGLDNDDDGMIDYPEDTGCSDANDNSE